MKRINYHCGWLAVILVGWQLSVGMALAETPLTADQIVAKAVQHAESPTDRESRPVYYYTKHTVTEELDDRGKIKDRKEKLYEVSVEKGLSYLKLIKLNGQDLSPAELKKQEVREADERQKMTDSKPGKKGDEREDFLTAELAQKFIYTLTGEKLVNGRKTYLLEFEPKSGLPVKKLTDRFANQMAGTVWFDAEDFEIARAQTHLKGEVALWGGVIGVLRHCSFTMERTRMPDGTWFNSSSHGIFEGRKLLEPVLIRTHSNSSDFRRGNLAMK